MTPPPPTDETAAVLGVQVGNLDAKLDAIHTSLKEDIRDLREGQREIEHQTRETNGRVTGHDRKLAELRGAYIAFGAASPFLVALLAFALVKLTSG